MQKSCTYAWNFIFNASMGREEEQGKSHFFFVETLLIYILCMGLKDHVQIEFQEVSHKCKKKTKTKAESSIKIAFYVFATISVVNARTTITTSLPSISDYLFGEGISSFCVHDNCTVLLPNGTSISLSTSEFYNFMSEYLDEKSKVRKILDLENQRNLEQPTEKNEGAENVFTESDFDSETTSGISRSSDEIIETINSNLSNSTSPTNETNATEHTSITIPAQNDEIDPEFDNFNDTELVESIIFLEEKSPISFSTEQKHEIRSRSILSISIDDNTSNLSSSINDSSSECPAPDPKRIPDDDPSDSTVGIDDSATDTQQSSTIPSIVKGTTSEMDYDYIDEKESKQQKPRQQVTQGDIEKAKNMTECIKLNTANGWTCVCNETYCDKFVPPDQTPKWTYTWYSTSKRGLPFRKMSGKLTPYKGGEEEAYYVDTRIQYQEIIGFGATFTDSACKLIQDLSKETRKKLLESYFGPFGINYRLGRVPIGGTDFSPRFYSYIDNFDESMKTFMLTEQDFKYKIPVILEASEMTEDEMKLIGTAWTSPIWMKMEPTEFGGHLYRKYYPQWADYHIKFLDQYQHNGVKFWAITTGKQPMNNFHIVDQPSLNCVEWTPYEQSYWVGSHLNPRLKNSSHGDVLLLGFDENREFITSYMKYFSENYRLEYFDDPSYIPNSNIMDAIAGIAFQGYMDHASNLPYLTKAKDMFPNKFFLYTETSCLGLGMPQSGSWKCGEIYATKLLHALNNWAVGWMDYNIALDLSGGPSYVQNVTLHSSILVDVKRDIFFKQPMFYIMAHFSIFLVPGSRRIEIKAPKRAEGIYAVGATLPDDATVIVFYNEVEINVRFTFIIDRKYKLSIEAPGKSINSVVFWL